MKTYFGKTKHVRFKSGKEYSWVTFKDGDVIPADMESLFTKEEKSKESKPDFDLNNDGVVDEKDRKVAAKLLGSRRGRRKKK